MKVTTEQPMNADKQVGEPAVRFVVGSGANLTLIIWPSFEKIGRLGNPVYVHAVLRFFQNKQYPVHRTE